MLVPVTLAEQGAEDLHRKKLKGVGRKCITGKGQRDAVTMRVRIYEKEGDIVPEVRPYRSEKDSQKKAPEVPPKKIRTKATPGRFGQWLQCQQILASISAKNSLSGPALLAKADSSHPLYPQFLACAKNQPQPAVSKPLKRPADELSDYPSDGHVLSDLTTDSRAE